MLVLWNAYCILMYGIYKNMHIYVFISIFFYPYFSRRLIVKVNPWVECKWFGFFVIIIICFLLLGSCHRGRNWNFASYCEILPLFSASRLLFRTAYLAHMVQNSWSASFMQTVTQFYLPTLLGLKQFLWAVQKFGCTASQSSL